MSPELHQAACAIVGRKGVPNNVQETLELLDFAMLEAATAARELCFQYPASEMSAATNNWEVGKQIVENITRRGA